jgi:hypothetical protein
MPITINDLKHFKAQYHPGDDTSQVGGAVTASEITGAVLGEVVPSGSMFVGSTMQVYHYKTFVKNTHASDAALAVKLWVDNGLQALDTAGRIELVSDNAGDSAPTVARVIGVSGGSVYVEEVTLSGTTPVATSATYTALYRVELRRAGAPQAAAGTIQVRRMGGPVLGIIPPGASMATAEVDVGLAPTANDNATSSNRRTAPTGVTYSRATTEATALAIGDMSAGTAWGVWRRYTFAADVPKADRFEVHFRIQALV